MTCQPLPLYYYYCTPASGALRSARRALFSRSTGESPRLSPCGRLTVSSVPRRDNTHTRAFVRARVCVSLATRSRLPRVYYACPDEIVHAPFVTHLPLPSHRPQQQESARRIILLEKLAQTKRKARWTRRRIAFELHRKNEFPFQDESLEMAFRERERGGVR